MAPVGIPAICACALCKAGSKDPIPCKAFNSAKLCRVSRPATCGASQAKLCCRILNCCAASCLALN